VEHVKNQRNNQPTYLQIAVFTGRIDAEENVVVLGGRGDGLRPSAAKAVMSGLNSRGFRVRGGGKTHHKPHNNQPLTL
jgi:hypothetical protein